MTQADERKAKIAALIESLAASDAGRELLGEALGRAGLAVLRTVEGAGFPAADSVRLANARQGVILDCETTGLDHGVHGVTQLAMLKFSYDDAGIIALGEVFDRLRDPGHPIPPEVTDLTGITDEMVAGQVIDDAEVSAFLEGTDLVVAHNARFDRKMCEACFPAAGLQAIRWDCSYEQVDWKGRGMPGGSLELIALRSGMVYGAHNALADIRCLALMLGNRSGDGPTAFAEMIQKGNVPKILIVAKDSLYDKKDELKMRGYRFCDDGSASLGLRKSWHVEIDGTPEKMQEEADYIRAHYGQEKGLPAALVPMSDRYSERVPARSTGLFRTAEPRSLIETLAQAGAVKEREEEPSFRF